MIKTLMSQVKQYKKRFNPVSYICNIGSYHGSYYTIFNGLNH